MSPGRSPTSIISISCSRRAEDRPQALHYAPLGHDGVRARIVALTAWIETARPARMVVAAVWATEPPPGVALQPGAGKNRLAREEDQPSEGGGGCGSLPT